MTQTNLNMKQIASKATKGRGLCVGSAVGRWRHLACGSS